MSKPYVDAHRRSNKKLEKFLNETCDRLNKKEPVCIDFLLHEVYHHLSTSEYFLNKIEAENG